MNMRIRKTPSQTFENIGRNQLGELLESHDFIASDIIPDYGEDFLIRIFEKGNSTGISFFLQLKCTDDITRYLLKSGDISYQLEVKDINHWDDQAVPVIIVLWDIILRKGWWVWIDDVVRYLEKNNKNWKQKEKVNFHILQSNQLNETGLKQIRNLTANLYFPIISKNKELIVKTKFAFPQTEEGKLRFEELQNKLATGDEIEIHGQYIEEFTLPDWWKKLYGEINVKDMYLKFSPRKPDTFYSTQIEFISGSLYEKLSFVKFIKIKEGTELLTLKNDQSNILFTLLLNKINGQSKLTINIQPYIFKVEILLQTIKIQKILSLGGIIRIAFLDTNEIYSINIPKNFIEMPEQEIIDFIEDVYIIQNTIKQEIVFPDDGSFAQRDILAVKELISIIRHGSYVQKGIRFTISLRKPGIEKIINTYTLGSPMYFKLITDESHVELLCTKVSLGPMEQKIKGFWNVPSEEVENWIKNSSDEDVFDIKLNDVELYEEFENWIKK